MTEIMRSRYCRICSKGAKRFLYQMTEEIRENFHSITNVHVSVNSLLLIFNLSTNLILAHKIRRLLESHLQSMRSKNRYFT